MFRRRFIAAIASLITALTAGAAFGNEVRIGFMPYLPYSGLLYAKEKGLIEQALKREGLQAKVTWKQFVAGAPVSEGLAANELDFGMFGSTPALVGRASGQDTRIFAIGSVAPKSHALVVRNDLPVSTVSQLKGMKVATTFGSTVFELLNSIAEEAGMTTNDFQLLNMTPADMSVALRTKAIDAAVVWDPLLLTLTGEKTVRILRDGVGLNDNINLLIGRAAYVKGNSAVSRAVIKGIEDGNRALVADLKSAADMLAPLFKLSPDVTLDALKRYRFEQAVSPDLQKQMERSVVFMRDKKLLRRSIVVGDFIDQSYLK